MTAFNALDIDAPITVTGAGKVALNYGVGGLSFDLSPGGFKGSLSYAAGAGEGIAGQALTINGTSYTLLYSMADVAGINASSGAYALATQIAASTAYTNSVVPSFSGTFEGLGNVITGLTINAGNSNGIGLFGTVWSGGLVRDFGLSGGTVSGGQEVGDLMGNLESSSTGPPGVVEESYVTGRVHGSDYVGGMIGINFGTIETSFAAGAVSGSTGVGGLIGWDTIGTIVNATYATGAVSATTEQAGGLVGLAAGSLIENSHATGAVSGGNDIGGLLGYAYAGGSAIGTEVENSYATGAVTGEDEVGGLVGHNEDYSPASSRRGYATGAVSRSRSTSAAWWERTSSASWRRGYATGAVQGNQYVGGLVGFNDGGSVETSYATGNVLGVSFIGGLVGGSLGGSVTDSYWDVDTSGLSSSSGGAGLTTGQLQSDFGGYVANLNSGSAAFAGGTGGLYPYLTALFPFGVQAITGTTTSGGAPTGGLQVGIYSNGVLLGSGLVSTGADGYVYTIVAAGKLGASGDKIGADLTLAGQASPVGLVYTDAGSPVSGILTLPALTAFQNAVTTGELTYSGLQTNLGATFGASVYAGLGSEIRQRPMTLTATGASFTLDQPLNTSGLTIQTGAGDGLTIADELALTGSGALDLDAGGALAIDAPINVTGGGQVALTNGAGASPSASARAVSPARCPTPPGRAKGSPARR